MSERKVHLWLKDIVDATQHIIDFSRGLDYENFASNLQVKHAVLHNFSIIGEAASKIPSEYKEQHQEVEWKEIKGFRNYVVHEYFGLDDTIVWTIIQTDLAGLLEKVSDLLNEELNNHS